MTVAEHMARLMDALQEHSKQVQEANQGDMSYVLGWRGGTNTCLAALRAVLDMGVWSSDGAEIMERRAFFEEQCRWIEMRAAVEVKRVLDGWRDSVEGVAPTLRPPAVRPLTVEQWANVSRALEERANMLRAMVAIESNVEALEQLNGSLQATAEARTWFEALPDESKPEALMVRHETNAGGRL